MEPAWRSTGIHRPSAGFGSIEIETETDKALGLLCAARAQNKLDEAPWSEPRAALQLELPGHRQGSQMDSAFSSLMDQHVSSRGKKFTVLHNSPPF